MTNEITDSVVNVAYDRMQEIKRDYQIKNFISNLIGLVLIACIGGSYYSFTNAQINTGWVMVIASVFIVFLFLIFSLIASMSEMQYKAVKETYDQLFQRYEKQCMYDF